MAQMPEEGRKFTIVDKDWRAIMTASVADTKALVVTDQPNMLATLKHANELLEEIQKVGRDGRGRGGEWSVGERDATLLHAETPPKKNLY